MLEYSSGSIFHSLRKDCLWWQMVKRSKDEQIRADRCYKVQCLLLKNCSAFQAQGITSYLKGQLAIKFNLKSSMIWATFWKQLYEGVKGRTRSWSKQINRVLQGLKGWKSTLACCVISLGLFHLFLWFNSLICSGDNSTCDLQNCCSGEQIQSVGSTF